MWLNVVNNDFWTTLIFLFKNQLFISVSILEINVLLHFVNLILIILIHILLVHFSTDLSIKVKVKRTCIAPLMKLNLKALRYGSHRVAPANYTIPASTLRTFASV